MKKLILTLIVLAVIGGGTYAYYKSRGTPEPTVSTAQLTRGDVVQLVQATGTLRAVKTVNVGTQVSGVVQELRKDFNDIVKKGEVIAQLDTSLIQTTVQQRQASVTRAETEVERLKVSLADAERKLKQAQAMWDKQLIPRDQLDTAELNVTQLKSQIVSAQAGLKQAIADLNTQEVNLGHTTIRAPIDGVVIQRSVDEGVTVQASMSAPTLYILAANLTEMEVLASIDEAEVGKIRPGQQVAFTVDSHPNDTFRGTVKQIQLQPATVQNVVTYPVVIDAPNPEYKLRPGMTATVEIEIARRDDVLRAPAAALRFRPTNDMFAALKQEVPAEMQRGGRGGMGGREGFGNRGQNGQGQPAAGAPAGQPGATPQAPPGGQPQARPGNQPGSQPQPPAGGANQNGQRSENRLAQGGGDRAGDRPAGGGRGFGNMTPEEREARRKQAEERLKNMSPEERERWEARMRDGGGRGGFRRGDGTPGGGGRGAGPGTANVERSARPGGERASADPQRGTPPSGGTIDALFAPLPPTEGRGTIWLFEEKKLRSVRVRTGITDGMWIELLDGPETAQLQPGTDVVTNIVTGLEPAARPGQQGQGSNPLMPQRGQPGRGGPGGGGGGGRGR
jgi:HlyD family secretion protein